jgi:hypothetical protein
MLDLSPPLPIILLLRVGGLSVLNNLAVLFMQTTVDDDSENSADTAICRQN